MADMHIVMFPIIKQVGNGNSSVLKQLKNFPTYFARNPNKFKFIRFLSIKKNN